MGDGQPIRRVLIVMAMEAESSPLVAALSLAETDSPGSMPFRWFRGNAASLDVMVAVNGRDPQHGVDSIGTVPAALNTQAAAASFEPDLIISAGTAGGWARHGTSIGDVFLNVGRFVHHDRRIDLVGFREYGVGNHPGLVLTGLARRLGLRTGLVTTSNSLDESPTDARHIIELGGEVKEMEAAAVAYVAGLLGIPMLAVKAITDLVDSPVSTPEQFITNLDLASERLRESVVAVLLELQETPLTDLA